MTYVGGGRRLALRFTFVSHVHSRQMPRPLVSQFPRDCGPRFEYALQTLPTHAPRSIQWHADVPNSSADPRTAHRASRVAHELRTTAQRDRNAVRADG